MVFLTSRDPGYVLDPRKKKPCKNLEHQLYLIDMHYCCGIDGLSLEGEHFFPTDDARKMQKVHNPQLKRTARTPRMSHELWLFWMFKAEFSMFSFQFFIFFGEVDTSPWKLTAGSQKWSFGSDDFRFQTGGFQGHVNFPGCIYIYIYIYIYLSNRQKGSCRNPFIRRLC